MSPIAISPAAPPTNGKSASRETATTSSTSENQIPAWVKPDLTRLLRVEHLPGSFASRSVSLVTLPAGAIFARISQPTPATCAYSSVQAGRDLHIELNCDLVYINHSCAPTLIFDMQRWEVRVNPERKEGLKEGDELTFFYPSTEWYMAQPFDCLCKAEGCKGRIAGARDMDRSVLEKYWLSSHIKELLEEKAAEGKNGL